ncbi:MAG: hypothetical protein ACREH9_02200 [Pseudomonadota bacterium]
MIRGCRARECSPGGGKSAIKGGRVEANVQHFMEHITCSECLQRNTPSRARVFVMVGEEEGDPAVIGFCYAHAAERAGTLKSLAHQASQAKYAPLAHRNVIPLRPRA